ncbi:MAG: hypothetical protein AAB681_03350 [Patescibacteria group bacterium]
MNGKIKLLVFISIVTISLPLLGIPRNTKNIILFIIGISSLLLVFSLKRGIKTLRLKLKRIEGQQGTLIQ